jgi:hypothetical protein
LEGTLYLSPKSKFGKINLSLNGYWNNITDPINFQRLITDGSRSFKGVPIQFAEIPQNEEGSVQTYGVTLTADLRNSWGDNGVWDTHFYAAYSFLEVDFPDSEQITFVTTAKHQIKTGVDLFYKKFSTSLRWRYRTSSESVVNNIRNDSFGILNFSLNYLVLKNEDNPKLNSELNVFLRATNVLDNKHYHVGAAGDSFGRTPQETLKIMVGLRFGINY